MMLSKHSTDCMQIISKTRFQFILRTGLWKRFVSKGYHNVQTHFFPFWFKMEQTFSGFGVTRFTSAYASACFLSPFPGPGVVLLGWEDLFPIHFQRLITGKLTGVDPFRPRNLQRGRVEILVHAFISSKLVYCISPLYGIPKYLVSRLQRVQNTAVHIVMLTRKYDSITPIMFKLLWLPVHSRIIFKLLLLVYKALNGKAPS